MKFNYRSALVASALLFTIGHATAAPASGESNPSVLTVKTVSISAAIDIAKGAFEEAEKRGWKVSVVVVDNNGNVKASFRGDGSNPHTFEFARLKAYTALTRKQTSLEFMNETAAPDKISSRQIPGVVAVGGGIPIKAGNDVIGAVGVSGAPGGANDEILGKAGLAKIESTLQ